jgi:serine/threonine protein kinase
MVRALLVLEKGGIIHRDIKTKNIFITVDGIYKLGDYSVAHIKGTVTMSVAGTEFVN